MELRPYQTDAIISILGAWAKDVQRPAAVLPTGAGKTVVFAKLCSMEARQGNRPLVLVNRDELVQQTVAKLKAADPHLSVGVIQGSQNDLRAEITVASVQTLSRIKRLHQLDKNRFNRIIADECHYAAADSWRRVLDYFGAFDKESGCKVVGFTATMVRTDKRGLGEIWDEVVYSLSIRWAINQGFLVAPSALAVTIAGLDTSKVRCTAGDYQDADLARAMAQAEAGPLVAAAYLEHCRDSSGELRRGICFTPTVALAHTFMRDFIAAGIPTQLVVGETPRAERQKIYADTAAGVNKVLMSVGVLTTGFDLPAVEVAVMARPTKSAGLYQQMVGRVLRPSPGKEGALILDVVGNSRMGLASIIDLRLDQLDDDEVLEIDELDEDGLPMLVPREFVDVPEEVGWQQVNPFDGTNHMGPEPVKKTKRPRAWRGWLVTKDGVPFLPSSTTYPRDTALVQTELGWEVWSVPTRNDEPAARMIGIGADFIEARDLAEADHPRLSKLSGLATDGQLQRLRNAGIPCDENTTKQEASELLAVLFASARLRRKR